MGVGLAVITYNRLDYLKQCIAALERNDWGGATHQYVVDDCSDQEGYKEYLDKLSNAGIRVIRLPENSGVATAKNIALQAMMEDGMDKLFLMEDDIIIKKSNTCIAYYAYGILKNIKHLNYALHGPLNKGKAYLNEKGICVYPDSVGAFSFYDREVIEKVGYLDENFTNAWEHVEHTYRIAQAGYTTPFWEFADIPNSAEHLEEIEGSIDNSSIRPRSDWQKNIAEGKNYWIQKHGKWLDEIPRPE